MPFPLLPVLGGAAAIGAIATAVVTLDDRRKAKTAAAKLQNRAQLNATVDTLPASAVSPSVATKIADLQIGISPDQGISDPQLGKDLGDNLAAAQATALASPSLENNVKVIQAAVDHAAFRTAENPVPSRPAQDVFVDPGTGLRTSVISEEESSPEEQAFLGFLPSFTGETPNFAARFHNQLQKMKTMHPRTVGTFIKKGI